MPCWADPAFAVTILAALSYVWCRQVLAVARGRRWTRASAVRCHPDGSVIADGRSRGQPRYATFVGPDGEPVVARIFIGNEDFGCVGDHLRIVFDPRQPTRAEAYVHPAWSVPFLAFMAGVLGLGWWIVPRIIATC